MLHRRTYLPRSATASALSLTLAGAALALAPTAANAAQPDDPIIVVEYSGNRIFTGDPYDPENLTLLAEVPGLPPSVDAADIDETTGTVYLTHDADGAACAIYPLDLSDLTAPVLGTPIIIGYDQFDSDGETPIYDRMNCGYGFEIDNGTAWITVELGAVSPDTESYQMATFLATVDLTTGELTPVAMLASAPPTTTEGDGIENLADVLIHDVYGLAVEDGIIAVITDPGDVHIYAIDDLAEAGDGLAVPLASDRIDLDGEYTWAASARGPELWVLIYGGGEDLPHRLVHTSESGFTRTGVLKFEGETLNVGGIFFSSAFESSPPETAALTLSATSTGAGTSVTVTGNGFPAEQEIDLELHSLPMPLGTTVSDAAGSFTLSVTIPSTVPAGSHHIVALVDGTAWASTAITITAAELAATGIDDVSPWLPWVGGGLLLLGLLVILAKPLAKRAGARDRADAARSSE